MNTAYSQWNFIQYLHHNLPYPNSSENVVKTCFLSANTGYYASHYSAIHSNTYTIYKTTDGWNTSTAMYSHGGDYYPDYLMDMCFLNETTGFKLCGNMFLVVSKTTNSGSSWTDVPNNTYTWLVSKISYPNENIGYYLASRDYQSSLINVIVSNNGFCTVDSLSDLYRNAYEIDFVNDSTGFIFCRDTAQNYICIQSTDSAKTWNTVLTSGPEKLMNIQFASPHTGYIAGRNGTLYKSVDSGQNWNPIATNASQLVNSLYFVNDSTGFLACNNGLLIKTMDGGISWSAENTGITNDIQQIYFANESTGYFLDNKGQMYKKSSLGIDEHNYNSPISNEVELFPNPASKMLNIRYGKSEQAFSFQILNQAGLAVSKTVRIRSGNYLDIDNLKPGVYFLKIESNEGLTLKKFVKL